MEFANDVLVVGRGEYGPFRDDVGTPREGRTIPYVEVVSANGEGDGGVMRATCAEGVDAPPRMAQIRARFRLTARDNGKLSLRYIGAENGGK